MHSALRSRFVVFAIGFWLSYHGNDLAPLQLNNIASGADMGEGDDAIACAQRRFKCLSGRASEP